MGWIAVGTCAIVAFVLLYSWITKGEWHRVDSVPTKTPQPEPPSEPFSDEQITQKLPALAPQLVFEAEEASNSPPAHREAKTERANTATGGKSHNMSQLQAKSMPPPPMAMVSEKSSGSMSPPRLKPPTVGPAPPRPGGSSLRPPPSSASSLRVPVTKVLSNTSMAPSSLMPPPKKVSKQVALEPGHSPLDWAALTSNPKNNLRGKDAPDNLIKITPSQLKIQNGRKGRDSWTVYQGKVYNITPYVPFHPGGKGEILRGAGKDSAKLFMEVHPWVNWDGMLGECLVGILVAETEADTKGRENNLDEMD